MKVVIYQASGTMWIDGVKSIAHFRLTSRLGDPGPQLLIGGQPVTTPWTVTIHYRDGATQKFSSDWQEAAHG